MIRVRRCYGPRYAVYLRYTSAKKKILTPEAPFFFLCRAAASVVACKDVEARLLRVWNRYTQFTCFTGTKVQILAPETPARVEQVHSVYLLYRYESTNTDT